jgi:alcohol dehydrogenase
VINASKEENLIEAILDISGGGGHVSIDALGSITTCRNSVLSLRKRGRHVQVGLMLADESDAPIPMGRVISKELEILGSHGMQAHRYGPMLEMIRSGKLDPKQLVGRTVSLEESMAVLEAMGEFGTTGIAVITEF